MYLCRMLNRRLQVYNSLSGKKEEFKTIHEGFVGMYVCGPTVYSDVHLGNCRTFVSFDIIYRYLLHIGYKVRYVRNITDVGHLLDDGEDRMKKGARIEKLEPMEIAQKYSNGFHEKMRVFNTHPPSIEPRATGHMIEQIDMIRKILENDMAYEVAGSVYFDTLKYQEKYKNYGVLSGRVVEELFSETRENLKNQGEKKHPADFALWIKADEDHIMRWPSPWSIGFPGWHLECSAMSTKYLGAEFDIHGGGNDLKFPHHENEIAQNVGCCGQTPAKYWLHTNMLLLNGKKMSKSDGNSIMPDELFTGESEHVSKGYHPMAIRFFMLQCHYRSTLDMTDTGLQASEKGYNRLMDTFTQLEKAGLEFKSAETCKYDAELGRIQEVFYNSMDDDFNTPKAIAALFDGSTIINKIVNNEIRNEELSKGAWKAFSEFYQKALEEILGLNTNAQSVDDDQDRMAGLMSLILDIRSKSRENKDWATSDKIRDSLSELNIEVLDGEEGSQWKLN